MIESNNATLSGVIEIHIDSDYLITCVKVLDLIPNGKGAVPSLNSGGKDHKFVFIDVEGQYDHGIHFKVIVWGIDQKNKKNSKRI